MKKKITIHLTISILTILFMSSGINSVQAKTALLSSGCGEPVELRFDAGEYSLIPIIIDGEKCVTVQHLDAGITIEKGFPALPFHTQSIIIPDAAEMGYKIISSTSEEISVNKIMPSKGSLTRNINPADVPYTFSDFYASDEWYPKQVISLGEPYILNSMRGLVVSCFPFQYNPKQGILRVITSMVVKIDKIGESTVNTLSKNEHDEIPPGFDDLFRSQFINYQQDGSCYTLVADGDKMIVIAPSDLTDAIKPFVQWKNQKGISTTLYSYPNETGGTGASALASFLKSKFSSNKYTYILLVGDDTKIPSKKADDNGLSDPSYIKLSGTDSYPDAFIGRFSAPSASLISEMVKKVLTYEKNPDPEKDWYAKAVGIASAEGQPTDKSWMDGFRTSLMSYGYTTVDKIYDPNATATQVSNALNNGRGWVNYMGHGSYNSWGTSRFSSSNVSSLQNGNMLPIIISVACNNGEFNKNSIAEAFTTASGKGAMVFAGSSIEMDWTPPQYAMEEMVKQLLTKDKCLSAGAIFYNGECKMLDKGGDAPRSLNTWNFFGDPSLMHFTKKPSVVTMTYPQTLNPGSQNVTVSFSRAVAGRVCISNPKIGILGSKMLSTGTTSVTLSITVASDLDSLILTATPFNSVPLIKTIDVPTGPFLRVTSPDAGSNFRPGVSTAIQWLSGGGASVASVKIDYSTNGGKTYTTITGSTANSGSYAWSIPDVMESDSCLVRVAQVGGTLSGLSGMFSIKQNPLISIRQTKFEIMLAPEATTSQNLTISNSGKTGLNYSISSAGDISEVMINELYVSKSAFFDGFELWNRGKEVDMSGWKLVWKDNQNTSGSYVFPQGFKLKKNTTMILMDDSSLTTTSTMLYMGKNLSWDRATTSLSIALIDNDSVGVDFVKSEGNQDPAPAGTSWQGSGVNLSNDYVYRAKNDDNDTASDWKASTSGTRNAINPGQSAGAASWLTVKLSTEGTTLAALNDTSIRIEFNAVGLSQGDYFDTLYIAHNDATKVSPIVIPCKLTVSLIPVAILQAQTDVRPSISIRKSTGIVYFDVVAPFGAQQDVKIYDLLGQLVYQQNGQRLQPWHLIDNNNKGIGSGVYCAVVRMFGKNIDNHVRHFMISVSK